ncbi:amidase [Paenibacillus sp. J22TS3]|uniref:amidase n=1 Tax=Paenibacillus sp. J22TS3 TaxID=2807192 RepID=UPI001B279C49|nr:amidase family protein [Paenibacillus sp. J22TS3]GIP21863.1 hypothetical protein J22TS3_21380 [Paenibacillus sp. J22TS3]
MSMIQIDYSKMSASEMAAGIAAGRYSSLEITSALIERLKQMQSSTRAVAIPLYEEALNQAAAADEAVRRGEKLGPLHGVPVTIKESIDVEGSPSTWGISHLTEPAATDDASVNLLRQAGAVIVAKTNVMQLLTGYESDNPVYGKVSNPWDLTRTPGGSSGGEGAAVAFGGSPLGIGSDIGGSVRVPAHFCGVHGLKPTPGRIPASLPRGVYHVRPEAGAMFSLGPLARSTEDLHLAMRVLASRQKEYPLERSGQSALELRVGIVLSDGIVEAHPAILRLLREASSALEARGIQVVPFTLPEPDHMVQTFYGLMTADGGQGMKRTLGDSPTAPHIAGVLASQGFPPAKRWLITKLLGFSGQKALAKLIVSQIGAKTEQQYQKLTMQREAHRELFIRTLDSTNVDVLLCPSFVTTAPPHGGTKMISFEGAYVSLPNYLGLPAGTLSLSTVRPEEALARKANPKDKAAAALADLERSSAGLPVSVQIMGRPFREDQVLLLMQTLENLFKTREDYPVLAQCRP